MRRLKSLALIAAAFATAQVFAQDDRVSLQLTPQPNQVIHLTMDQAVDMRVDGAPVAIQAKTIAALTQTVGARDASGRLESSLAYDRFSLEMTMNGSPLPSPAFDLVGKVMTLVYDEQGALVELTTPPGMDPAISRFVKTMLDALYQNRADTTLLVGETATLPFSAGLPMPSLPAPPAAVGGETRMKLVAVDRVNAERIARFEQTIESTATSAPTGPSPQMTMKASGSGTMEWNLDRGYVKSGDVTIAIESEVMQARMYGTIRTTMRGSN
jgi:hypothetical protein